MVVGENYRFGHRAAGDAITLRRMGFHVDALRINGGVSSTRIRDLVRSAEFSTAARLLGRPCEIEGTVLPGGRAGRLPLRTESGGLLPPTGTSTGRAIGRRVLVAVGAAAAGRVDLQFTGPASAPNGIPVRVHATTPPRSRKTSQRCWRDVAAADLAPSIMF